MSKAIKDWAIEATWLLSRSSRAASGRECGKTKIQAGTGGLSRRAGLIRSFVGPIIRARDILNRRDHERR